jgi:protoporphyrinogen oxidase
LREAKYLILGAGLAGLSAAFHLGRDYAIFEKTDRVGGLAYSEKIDDFILDYCVHVLYHKDQDIRRFCDELLGENTKDHIRSTWIYSKRVYTQYPFQANLYGLPLDVVGECISGFIDAKYPLHPLPRATNFHEFNLNTFGEGIVKHFMLPFNQKLWTVHPRKMSTEWVEGIVPQPEVEDIIDGALPGQKRLFGFNAYFRYPKRGGIRSLSDALHARVEKVNFGFEAVEIDTQNKTVRFSNFDEPVKYDKLISTLPMKYIPNIIKGVPDRVKKAADKLIHNSVECINVAINRPIDHQKHWIYYPESKFPFYRIMLPHTMSEDMVPPGKGAFSVEVSHGNDRKVDLSRVESDVIHGLRKAGLMGKQEEPLFVFRLSVPCAYSIYTKKRPKAIELIRNYLEKNSIYSLGRYGNWEYSNMEKAIIDGRDIAAFLGEKVRL